LKIFYWSSKDDVPAHAGGKPPQTIREFVRVNQFSMTIFQFSRERQQS